jgi:hypothetical protein
VEFLEVGPATCIQFFRVEREHLFNVGTFKATDELTFPYPNIRMDPAGENSLFQNELANLIHEEPQDDSSNEPKSLAPKPISKSKSEDKRQALRSMMAQRHVSILEDNVPDLPEILQKVKAFKVKLQEQISSFSIDPMKENFNKSTINMSPDK